MIKLILNHIIKKKIFFQALITVYTLVNLVFSQTNKLISITSNKYNFNNNHNILTPTYIPNHKEVLVMKNSYIPRLIFLNKI